MPWVASSTATAFGSVKGMQRMRKGRGGRPLRAGPASTWRRSATWVLTLFVLAAVVVSCRQPDSSGTAWGEGSFSSNGERIYFTGTSERTGRIDYSGGVDPGGMMMGGRLSCASCHGPDARGGTHQMHMDVMDAPNIRWSALAEHGDDHTDEGASEEPHDDDDTYDLEVFQMAVVDGLHPDGEPLSDEMPRWDLSDEDLADLAEYLQSFTSP